MLLSITIAFERRLQNTISLMNTEAVQNSADQAVKNFRKISNAFIYTHCIRTLAEKFALLHVGRGRIKFARIGREKQRIKRQLFACSVWFLSCLRKLLGLDWSRIIALGFTTYQIDNNLFACTKLKMATVATELNLV